MSDRGLVPALGDVPSTLHGEHARMSIIMGMLRASPGYSQPEATADDASLSRLRSWTRGRAGCWRHDGTVL